MNKCSKFISTFIYTSCFTWTSSDLNACRWGWGGIYLLPHLFISVSICKWGKRSQPQSRARLSTERSRQMQSIPSQPLLPPHSCAQRDTRSEIRGLIYNRCVRTKWGLKLTYATSHANVGIYKMKIDANLGISTQTLTHSYERFGDRKVQGRCEVVNWSQIIDPLPHLHSNQQL